MVVSLHTRFGRSPSLGHPVPPSRASRTPTDASHPLPARRALARHRHRVVIRAVLASKSDGGGGGGNKTFGWAWRSDAVIRAHGSRSAERALERGSEQASAPPMASGGARHDRTSGTRAVAPWRDSRATGGGAASLARRPARIA